MGNSVRKADMSGGKGNSKKGSNQHTHGKNKRKSAPQQNVTAAPEAESQDPEVRALNRLRKSIKKDLPMFLLNNVLMSVQFFENYEREVAKLNATPVTEEEARRNQQLREQQRHCITPDRLHEVVASRVLFRPQHGPCKHQHETLHSQTLVVVQDNVQLQQTRDPHNVVSCSGGCGVSYELTLEDVRPGYVKLCNVGIPNKRRTSYEVIESITSDEFREELTPEDVKDEGIDLNDRIQPTGNVERSVDVVEDDISFPVSPPTDTSWSGSKSQPSKGENFMRRLQEQVEGRGVAGSMSNLTFSTQESVDHDQERPVNEPSNVPGNTKFQRHVFGPRIPENNLQNSPRGLTATERRLSGILKTPRQQSVLSSNLRNEPPKVKLTVTNANSLPNLSTPKLSPASSRVSPASSESSGYKSNSSNTYTVSLPNSRGSDSEYGYGIITELRTPKPVEMLRLGKTPIRSSEIPNECFWMREVPRHETEDDDTAYKVKGRGNGGSISTGKLFHTQYYLNSTYYMSSFADVFVDRLFEPLGFTKESMKAATMQGAKINCEIIRHGPDSTNFIDKMNVVPSLTCRSWPNEAIEWLLRARNRMLDPRTHASYAWPTRNMVDKIQNMGYNILPVGYLPTRGRNNEHQFEWQLAFPQAEAFLESCLTHAQMRCYLFVMALYKSFLDPLLNSELSLSPAHIRTLLFWQCEQNYLAWPEDRPGETLYKFLNKIYDALKKERLPDYFLPQRNLFESSPLSHLRRVQEKLCRVQENLIMHMLVAVRNLRYVNKDSFYPVLDYKQLYHIITTDDFVTLLNPTLGQVTKKSIDKHVDKDEVESGESDEELHPIKGVWKAAKKYDKNRQWHKEIRRQIDAEKAAQRFASGPRVSTESINVKLQPRVSPDPMRRKLLLELFIPHFIEMGAQSNKFRAYHQAQMYLQHAHRLSLLLCEEPAADQSVAQRFLFRIKILREATSHNASSMSPTVQSQGFTFLPTNNLRSAPIDLIFKDKLAENYVASSSKSSLEKNIPTITIAQVHNIRLETDTDTLSPSRKPLTTPADNDPSQTNIGNSPTLMRSLKTNVDNTYSVNQKSQLNTDIKIVSEERISDVSLHKTTVECATSSTPSRESASGTNSDDNPTLKRSSQAGKGSGSSFKHNSKLNTGAKSVTEEKTNDDSFPKTLNEADEESEEEWSSL